MTVDEHVERIDVLRQRKYLRNQRFELAPAEQFEQIATVLLVDLWFPFAKGAPEDADEMATFEQGQIDRVLSARRPNGFVKAG